MKKIFVTAMLLGSTVACTGNVLMPGGDFGSGSGGTGGASQATGGSGTGGSATGGSSTGGSGTGGSGTGGNQLLTSGLPCDVATLLQTRCASCHGATPLPDLPSLTTYAALTGPSRSDPTKTFAVVALERMRSVQSPMPPIGVGPATSAEIAAMQGWVDGNYPSGSCAGTPDGGTSDAGSGPDPFAVSATCTSNTTWTRGNKGSEDMNPGMACIACHATSDEGPTLAIAGTLYPSAHEPDLCNGMNGAGSSPAQIVVTGADGKVVTLTPNAAGNFLYNGALAKPFTAKVTYMGKVRAMATAQTSGDCNSCHTQAGTNSAPGRILTP